MIIDYRGTRGRVHSRKCLDVPGSHHVYWPNMDHQHLTAGKKGLTKEAEIGQTPTETAADPPQEHS